MAFQCLKFVMKMEWSSPYVYLKVFTVECTPTVSMIAVSSEETVAQSTLSVLLVLMAILNVELSG